MEVVRVEDECEENEQLSSSLSESSSSEEAAHESYAADTEDGDTQRQDVSQTESQTSHSLLSSRLSASTEPFRHYSNIRDRADLLCAQGRILKLETMVESMERANKRARVEEEIEEEGAGVREAAKLHKLEQDRRLLSEQLESTREKLVYTESACKEATTALEKLEQTSLMEKNKLRDQYNEVKRKYDSLKSENDYQRARIELSEEQTRIKCLAEEETEQNYQEIIGSLKDRVLKLEEEELEVIRLKRRVMELERVVSDEDERRRIVEVSYQQLMDYERMKQQNTQLLEENSVLRQNTDNVKLLTYQLQTQRQRCEKLSSIEGDYERLKLENKELQEKLRKMSGAGADGSPSSPSLLQYKVSQLLQKEAILSMRIGELETQVKVSEQGLASSRTRECELRRFLAKEKVESKTKSDTIQRLERRLQFISKERDGYVNVLNSYKLDQGVNSVLKELVTELEQGQSQNTSHITELEAALNEQGTALAAERQKAVEAEEKLSVLETSLETADKKIITLESEKQRLEALVMTNFKEETDTASYTPVST